MGAVALVVIAAVLAPLAVVGLWAHEHIFDTDGYVETVGPLAENSAITDAVAERVVDVIFEQADLEERITHALPGVADVLGDAISSSARSLATRQAEKLLASDTFAELWERANRLAHEQVVAMFSGRGQALTTRDDQVVLDLGVVADDVRARLVDHGVSVLDQVEIPKGEVEIVLFQSDTVTRLQWLFRTLDDASWIVPIVAVLAATGAIVVSVRRRRTILELALAIAGSTLVLLVVLLVARRRYLAVAADRDLDRAGAAAVFDTLFGSLQRWAWILLAVAVLVAVLVAVVAFVSAPARRDRWFRRDRGSPVPSS